MRIIAGEYKNRKLVAPKDLKMNLCPVFVSNFDFDEIKRMQHDTEFAIVTPLRDFDKLKGDK